MPVGAGDGALARIEAALAAEDPALVESFHRGGTLLACVATIRWMEHSPEPAR